MYRIEMRDKWSHELVFISTENILVTKGALPCFIINPLEIKQK